MATVRRLIRRRGPISAGQRGDFSGFRAASHQPAIWFNRPVFFCDLDHCDPPHRRDGIRPTACGDPSPALDALPASLPVASLLVSMPSRQRRSVNNKSARWAP